MIYYKYFGLLLVPLFMISCKNDKTEEVLIPKPIGIDFIKTQPKNIKTPYGMVWIPGGEFYQGAIEHDTMAMIHERPRHKVILDGFFMDLHPVTNREFKLFVEETGYITMAEREVKWEELKKQLPPDTPKPHDSILQPGSLVFRKTKTSVPNLYDSSQWWQWKTGTNWKKPNGPDSSINGKDDYPVVQISYEDALAYCNWIGRRLPTEAEWEYAARGNKKETLYFWGNETKDLKKYANTWEGEFPVENIQEDGFEFRSPVMSFPKNSFELYGMAGNIWEWTSDWYDTRYYSKLKKSGTSKNPKGPVDTYNPNNLYAKEKVIRGGSFLCSDSYCASYRVSARMSTSIDTSLEHLGFRTVMDISNIKF